MDGEERLVKHLGALNDPAELLDTRRQLRDRRAGAENLAGDGDRPRT
jgi:hypothetical protein